VIKFKAYLRLMRLPNIVTAMSDILAGIAIGASNLANTFGGVSDRHISFGELLITNQTLEPLKPISLLVLSTIGLYGGGVVLNDVFDAELDKVERPERPIPSGAVSRRAATIFGILLLCVGVIAAALAAGSLFSYSALIAFTIAIAAILYDRWAKHNDFFGPLVMGFCRACNLLLGISILAYSVPAFWHVALVPLVYIAAITMVSRGEVHGGRKGTLYFAMFLYAAVILAMVFVSLNNSTVQSTLPFLLILALMILVPLQAAIQNPSGPAIGKAVKGGVIGLIALNAAWAAAFGDIFFAIVIILLLPVSIGLSRMFAVT
jgi:4-hydroxybenzoate polyprenyltransferase